ncbi:MAG: flagellar biosynthesis protein FlhF, partial [Rhodocyclaceae bacterium]|nr:flagellar biosynthesis protein FlhF [Rhodocyclaceae bacterium]
MNVKRYVAESAREALRRVKEELGPDAIVVSNKAVPGGVEIMALSADGLEALSRPAMAGRPSVPAAARPAPVAAPAVAAPAEAGEDYTVTLSSRARKQPAPPPFQPWQPPRHPAAAEDRPRPRPLPPRPAEAPSREQVTAALRQAGEADAALREGPQAGEIAVLMREMKAIKGLLEQQLAGFAWGEMARIAPGHAVLLAEMLDAGFSGLLARRLMDEMPSDMEAEEGRRWLKTAINRRLRTPANDADLVDRGGVYALVGPTGVGKTTTTAKLAARCVVRHGADRLALLTTDGYRIGAHEQLRIYGRILGVPVHVVRDGADLRDKHMVLIDTVGMSQRDRMVAEQAAMLAGAGEVRRLLLLNAT